MTVTAPATAPVVIGTWTILCEGDETVRATITREKEKFTVRDADGKLMGRYATVELALECIAA